MVSTPSPSQLRFAPLSSVLCAHNNAIVQFSPSFIENYRGSVSEYLDNIRGFLHIEEIPTVRF